MKRDKVVEKRVVGYVNVDICQRDFRCIGREN